MCLYQLISKDIWCLTFVLRYNFNNIDIDHPLGEAAKTTCNFEPWQKMKTTKGYFWGKNWSAVPPTARGLVLRETPGPKPLGWRFVNNGNCFFFGGIRLGKTLVLLQDLFFIGCSGAEVLYNLIEQHSTTQLLHSWLFQCSIILKNRLLNGKYIH